MGTYNNLNKKAKTIVDAGLVLGILSDIGSGLSLIVYETNDALFPKISIKTRGCSKLVSIIRKDGLELVFNLVLMSSAQNTVGIKAETYGLVGLNTYKFDGKESRLLSTRELTHYYLQEGFEHNLVPLKHSVDVLSKLNVLPDQATDLLPSMLPALVKAVGIGPLVFEKTRNYLSKLYLLQDELLGLGIMKRK